jgi:hypothetical protein
MILSDLFLTRLWISPLAVGNSPARVPGTETKESRNSRYTVFSIRFPGGDIQ